MYIIYDGPSQLDGKPIVVLVSGVKTPSTNPKTGRMAQSWILRKDVHPHEAVQSGADSSICGDCKLRNTVCYVSPGMGPSSVWKAYWAGKYKPIFPEELDTILHKKRLPLRMGAYGDPAAAPYETWSLATASVGHTGYTHQWRFCDQRFRELLMASVDTPQEYLDAQDRGWRTFRIRTPEETLFDRERICPASHEGDFTTLCQTCQLCDGQGDAPRRKNIAIIAHGSQGKGDAFERLRRFAA